MHTKQTPDAQVRLNTSETCSLRIRQLEHGFAVSQGFSLYEEGERHNHVSKAVSVPQHVNDSPLVTISSKIAHVQHEV